MGRLKPGQQSWIFADAAAFGGRAALAFKNSALRPVSWPQPDQPGSKKDKRAQDSWIRKEGMRWEASE